MDVCSSWMESGLSAAPPGSVWQPQPDDGERGFQQPCQVEGTVKEKSQSVGFFI